MNGLDKFFKPQAQLTQAELEEFRKVMADIANGDREKAKAVATLVVKYIKESIDQRDLGSLLLGVENFPLGTTPEYILRGKPKVYWHEPGSYAPRTQIVNETFTIPSAMLSCHPEYELGQLKTGRYGSMVDITNDARDEMFGAINALVWNTVKGAVSSGSNYASLSAKITRAALAKAVRYMDDQPGGAVAIVGRKNVLTPICDWNVGNSTVGAKGIFGDGMMESIFRGGLTSISEFEGVPVIGLSQWKDAYNTNTISESDILVIGQNVGKVALVEDFNQLDGTDIDTLMWHIHIWKRMGCAVFKSDRIYRIANLSTDQD